MYCTLNLKLAARARLTAVEFILFLACATSAPAQIGAYGGPSILTRGQVPSTQSEAMIGFRPYVAVTSIYDTALTGIVTDQQGNPTPVNALGVEGQIGAYGYHGWKKTLLGLDYRGSFRHYTSNTYYDGTDQMLALSVSRQLSRHMQLQAQEMGGILSRGYGYYSNTGFMDTSSMQVPNNELFNNPVYYLASSADLVYQKSARLSFSGGGQGFMARHRSSSLFGVSGDGARGEVTYRLSRFSTVGVQYQFLHYGYTKAFGTSDIHNVALNYALRPTRRWELAVRLGGARMENLFLSRVAIDPIIAALTGIHAGIQAAYRVQYMPDIAARINRSFKHASLNLAYIRQASAGNGMYVISAQESTILSYTYTGIRGWNFGANAGFYKLHPLMQSISNYTTYYTGVGVTRQLKHDFHLIARFDARRISVPGSTLNWNPYRATIGFAYSPGEIPLSLW